MNDFLQSLRNGQADKPRAQKTRKSHDNSYHYTSAPRYNSYSAGFQNTRNQQMKRPAAPAPNQVSSKPVSDDLSTTAMLTEAIDTLGAHIETLAKNQEFLVAAQEKTADMLERQATAIERIAEHLNQNQEAAPKQPSKKAFRNHYITTQKPKTQAKPAKTAAEAISEQAKPARTIIRKRKGVVTRKPIESTVTGTRLLSRDEVMDIINTMRAEGATFDQVASRLVELGQPTFSGRGEWHAQTIHRLCNKK